MEGKMGRWSVACDGSSVYRSADRVFQLSVHECLISHLQPYGSLSHLANAKRRDEDVATGECKKSVKD